MRLSIYDGMFHMFQMALLMVPESKKAWKEVGRFLEIVMREKQPAIKLTKREKRKLIRELKKRE